VHRVDVGSNFASILDAKNRRDCRAPIFRWAGFAAANPAGGRALRRATGSRRCLNFLPPKFRSGRNFEGPKKLRHLRFGPVLRRKTGLEVRALRCADWRGIGPVFAKQKPVWKTALLRKRGLRGRRCSKFCPQNSGVAEISRAPKLRASPVWTCFCFAKAGMEARFARGWTPEMLQVSTPGLGSGPRPGDPGNLKHLRFGPAFAS